MRAPGLGIVLRKDSEVIEYRYLPLTQPVAKYRIEREFQADDLAKFKNRRFAAFWLFEISRESFVGAIGGQAIAWP